MREGWESERRVLGPHDEVSSGIVGAQNKAEPQRFDGETFEEGPDEARLKGQLRRVPVLMKDNAWRTPKEVGAATGIDWSSINARLRNLGNARFDRYGVDRDRVDGGLCRYRLALTANPTWRPAVPRSRLVG